MADIVKTTKRGNITDANTAKFAVQFAGDMTAGESIAPGSPCEIRAGGPRGVQVFKLTSTGVFAGINHEAKLLGQPVTLYGNGIIFHAVDTALLVPGAAYYLSATPGAIADAATAKDTQGAFLALTPYKLMVIKIGRLA